MSHQQFNPYRRLAAAVLIFAFAIATSVLGRAAGYTLPPNITNNFGSVFKAVKLMSVEPDGLLVSFQPAAGGTGIAKLKFKDLPDELGAQFRYDPEKSAAYEAAQDNGKAQYALVMQENFRTACQAAAMHREESYQELKRQDEERQERARLEEERKLELARLEHEREMAKLQPTNDDYTDDYTDSYYDYSSADWVNGFLVGKATSKTAPKRTSNSKKNVSAQLTPAKPFFLDSVNARRP